MQQPRMRIDPSLPRPTERFAPKQAAGLRFVATLGRASAVATNVAMLLVRAERGPMTSTPRSSLMPAGRTSAISRYALEDTEGRMLELGAFPGKVILMDVWATWCTLCRAEMPPLDQHQVALGGADFEVATLSVDRRWLPAVQKFYEQVGVGHVSPDLDPAGNVMQVLDMVSVPTTLLIDRDGREVRRLVGPTDWTSSESIGQIRRALSPAGGET